MCNRFIEDFVEKTIKHIDYKNIDSKKLKEIYENVKEILIQRCQILNENLKDEVIGEYSIKSHSIYALLIQKNSERLFSIYCDKAKFHIYDGDPDKKIFTKEELIEYMFKFSEDKEFYNSCITKINIIEELDSIGNINNIK